MTVKIRSLLASGPLTVPLLGGGAVHLAPGETSPELPDVEAAENAKVAVLRDRGLIGVETVPKPRSRPAAAKPEPAEE